MGERVTLQQRQQCDDDAGADRGRSGDDEGELSTVHRSSFRNRRAHSSRTASFHKIAIEINRLPADRLGREARDRQPPRRRAITGAQIGRRRQGSRSRRPGPADRRTGTSRPVSPGMHDFAASRHVGGDHRPAAGRGLQQAFRQSLAPRWQDRDVGARPERRNVLDMTEPGDAGLPAPAGDFLLRSPMPDWPDRAFPRSAVRRSSRAARSSRWAAISVRMPLSARSRPTKAIVGAPGGSGCGCSMSTSTPEPGIVTMRSARCRAKACCRGRRDFAPGPSASGG